MSNEKVVVSKDKDGNEVTVYVKRPSFKDQEAAQIEYNRTFRLTLEAGCFLKAKLNDYLVKEGLWSADKQKKFDELVEKIRALELALKRGGIRLHAAKKVALDLSDARNEYRELLSERSVLDDKSAEGQADSQRFNYLLICCILDSNKNRVFKDLDSYFESVDQPWVSEAASQFASMFYDIDPDYDKKLVENKFLREHGFVNDKLQFINKEGHLTDRDGRLVDGDGKYIKYVDGVKVFVNIDGEDVNVEFTPFLEDEVETPSEDKAETA